MLQETEENSFSVHSAVQGHWVKLHRILFFAMNNPVTSKLQQATA